MECVRCGHGAPSENRLQELIILVMRNSQWSLLHFMKFVSSVGARGINVGRPVVPYTYPFLLDKSEPTYDLDHQ
jgi:hypothetical protein